MEATAKNNAPSPPLKAGGAVEDIDRLAFAALWLLGVFAVSLVAAGVMASRLDSGLLWNTDCFLGWGALVALIHFLFLRFQVSDLRAAETADAGIVGTEARIQREPLLPWFRRTGQVACLIVGGLALLGVLQGSLRMKTPLSTADSAAIRLAGILFLAMSFGLYFISRFVTFVQSQHDKRTLNGPLYLARLGFWICLISAACLFTFLYAGRDLGLWVGRLIGLVTILLMVDAWIRAGLAVFQPRALLKEMAPLGGSLALETLFRRGNPWDALIHHMEASFGVKVGEGWILPFLRRTIEPVVLLGIILLWLSTCFTAVPPQSHGVRVRWGRYLTPALEPGLYVTWPWPAEMIEIVPTERVEQIALGFEHDLGGPMLWTETHYEGEQNLLVGNGEELLSISVPVYYRIKDPLAYLKTTTNAREALINFAYRQLLAVTEARDSFRVMTVERQEISRALKQSLQQEVDRMQLGLEIVYVGLKDVHPPVAVAPAFQDVVSAEEQKLADLDEAAAYHFQTLAEAGQQANRLRTAADAAFKQRTAQAEGESARFVMLAAADAANTNLFRLRLQLETLEQALAGPQKVVLTRAAATNEQFYLDMRGLGGLPLP
ncbi:MAG TPA: protease modulator HflK [Verrucomicrobiae bacterium]|nr:protease modulator HflK [Verrucomicrobiae bacterium]